MISFLLAFPALSQAISTVHTSHCFLLPSPEAGSITQSRAEPQFSYNISCNYIGPVYTYIGNTVSICIDVCVSMSAFTHTDTLYVETNSII